MTTNNNWLVPKRARHGSDVHPTTRRRLIYCVPPKVSHEFPNLLFVGYLKIKQHTKHSHGLGNNQKSSQSSQWGRKNIQHVKRLFSFLAFKPRHAQHFSLPVCPCAAEVYDISPWTFNLQATRLFIVTSATKGVVTPLRISVWFKTLNRVIQQLIHHCFLSEMVYMSVKYVIATRNYEFCLLSALVRNKRTFALPNRNDCTCWKKYKTASYRIE